MDELIMKMIMLLCLQVHFVVLVDNVNSIACRRVALRLDVVNVEVNGQPPENTVRSSW